MNLCLLVQQHLAGSLTGHLPGPCIVSHARLACFILLDLQFASRKVKHVRLLGRRSQVVGAKYRVE